MKRGGKFGFLKVVGIFIISTIWISLIFYKQLPQILKPAIAQKILDFYQRNPGTLKTLFYVRVILISLIPLIILFIFLKIFVFQTKKELEGIDLKEIQKKSKTDLDYLYAIIQLKKELKISSIAELFKIKKDLAMEWAKILEFGELASIEYPGFGGPSLKIIEEVKTDEELENSKNKTPDKKMKKDKEKEDKSKEEIKVERKSKRILTKNLKKAKKEIQKGEKEENKKVRKHKIMKKKAAKSRKKEIKLIKKEIKSQEKKWRK